jgi:hypothetical protein
MDMSVNAQGMEIPVKWFNEEKMYVKLMEKKSHKWLQTEKPSGIPFHYES